MSVHAPLAHLVPRASRSASTRGHTLGAPRVYDTLVELWFVGRRRALCTSLVSAAGVAPGQRVLDVGCGTGYLASLLAEKVGPAGFVVGLDASGEMIAYAARRHGRANCQFRLGTAESLDLPDEHFDVVVSSLFMHHLPDDLHATALAEMHRVLRPGGTLLIAEAQLPRARGWRLLARLHGLDRMASAVAGLETRLTQANFEQLRGGEAPPWLRYVRATRSPQTSPQ
jgi:ubiquinone/menaquinone biosynthesis C-methylase UbiE